MNPDFDPSGIRSPSYAAKYPTPWYKWPAYLILNELYLAYLILKTLVSQGDFGTKLKYLAYFKDTKLSIVNPQFVAAV